MLGQQNAQVQQAAAAANERLATQVPQLLEGIQQAVTSREKTRQTLVDPKGIGKPQMFYSDEHKFRPWAKKTESFITSIFPDLEPVFEWSVDHEGVISVEDVECIHGG